MCLEKSHLDFPGIRIAAQWSRLVSVSSGYGGFVENLSDGSVIRSIKRFNTFSDRWKYLLKGYWWLAGSAHSSDFVADFLID